MFDSVSVQSFWSFSLGAVCNRLVLRAVFITELSLQMNKMFLTNLTSFSNQTKAELRLHHLLFSCDRSDAEGYVEDAAAKCNTVSFSLCKKS